MLLKSTNLELHYFYNTKFKGEGEMFSSFATDHFLFYFANLIKIKATKRLTPYDMTVPAINPTAGKTTIAVIAYVSSEIEPVATFCTIPQSFSGLWCQCKTTRDERSAAGNTENAPPQTAPAVLPSKTTSTITQPINIARPNFCEVVYLTTKFLFTSHLGMSLAPIITNIR